MIPNDSKSKRKKIFLQLATPDPKTGYIDGATDYSLLKPFSRDLSQEGKYWLAFLYSLSYSCTTAIRIFMEFPSINDVKPALFHLFWKENKPTLWFNPDRKYLKNMNQVGASIHSIQRLCNKDFEQYLEELLNQGFDKTYKEIKKKWRFFGPMGAYLFFDAIYGLCPEKYSDPTNLDWKNSGQTVVEGMAHLLYNDEAIKTRNFDFERYNKAVNKLVDMTKLPKIIIESVLCFFRKLFKGTRYLGYYADRQLTECIATADLIEQKYHKNIWLYRKASVQDNLRGEIHGWGGIRTELLTKFLETGGL